MRDKSNSNERNLKIDRRTLSNSQLVSKRWRERELRDKIIKMLNKVRSR